MRARIARMAAGTFSRMAAAAASADVPSTTASGTAAVHADPNRTALPGAARLGPAASVALILSPVSGAAVFDEIICG
jgi:hypothetical protein